MKRLISMLLVLLLSCGTAFAETTESREMTSEEQAYNIYLDIAHVYEYSVRYLEEMGRVWEIVLSAKDIEEINDLSYLDCFPQEPMSSLYSMYLSKYGYSVDELRQLSFSSDVFSVSEKTDLIWVVLALEEESGYIDSPHALKASLDRAFDNIRTLMAADKEYAFLSELKDYYKDAVLLYEYIADFKDNYTGFSAKLDTFKTNKSSWEVDFEFIFDPAGYRYVSEIRAAQQKEENKKNYDRALAYEKEGDYTNAREYYWLCNGYEDAYDRMSACTEKISAETAKAEQAAAEQAAAEKAAAEAEAARVAQEYEEAIEFEKAGKYEEALAIYQSLGDYEDSKERCNLCTIYVKAIAAYGADGLKENAKIINTYSVTYTNHNGQRGVHSEYEMIYSYDEQGNLISKEKIGSLPQKETYVVDAHGNVVKGNASGNWASESKYTFVSTTEYDEIGNLIKETTTYTSPDNWIYKNGSRYVTEYQYTYGANGEILSKKVYSDGSLTRTYYYEYEYDKDGRVASSIEKTDSGKLKYITHFYYDGVGLLIHQTRAPLNPEDDSMYQITGIYQETEITYKYDFMLE